MSIKDNSACVAGPSDLVSQVQILLRKEVIQPHVPVGLPCYDLAPVTGLTFGGFPPYGLVYRLRVLPAPIA